MASDRMKFSDDVQVQLDQEQEVTLEEKIQLRKKILEEAEKEENGTSE